MGLVDWGIVIVYLAVLVGMSFFIGSRQKDQDDYYLGGRTIRPWQLGVSMAANQVSAISLVGVPAFIAVKRGGGLVWLQYEMAIPLAMIVIIVLLVPLFRATGSVSIYRYLEDRFGRGTRLCMSMVFLVSRSLAAGVALLATAYVTSACAGLGLFESIALIGLVLLLYTSVGGIRADIYSDILQLALLWMSSFVVIGLLVWGRGFPDFTLADPSRLRIFDLSAAGLGRGNTFSFWPMIIGGFFLYISYYGCDQSQAQRLLSAETDRGAQRSLVINSLVRFPLVITYSIVGLLLIDFLARNEPFAAEVMSGPPDMLMPAFFVRFVPSGLLGLMVAGIFAASMSSLDSTINSLSAATWEDFLVRLRPSWAAMADRKKIWVSRFITLVWGLFAVSFALMMAGRSETVVELVNKIGSAFYGPIAGVFVMGIAVKNAGQPAALAGLVAGVASNILFWIFFSSQVSWMWWNCTGFAVTMGCGLLLSLKKSPARAEASLKAAPAVPRAYVAAMLVWFGLILLFCLGLEKML